MEEGKRKEAEVMAKANAQRAAAIARAAKVAAQKVLKEQELENQRETEARLKREKVAAVLARKDADVVERERQIRRETLRRIRLEEQRREQQRKREEDEREERMRLYEAGERASAATAIVDPGGREHHRNLPGPPPSRSSTVQPAVQSARSFFSLGTRSPYQHSVTSGSSISGDVSDSGDNAGDVKPTMTTTTNNVGRNEERNRKRGKRLHHCSTSPAQDSASCQTPKRRARVMTENITGAEYDCADKHEILTSTNDPTSTQGENIANDHVLAAPEGRSRETAPRGICDRRHNRPKRGGYSQLCRKGGRSSGSNRSGGGGGENQRGDVSSRQDVHHGASVSSDSNDFHTLPQRAVPCNSGDGSSDQVSELGCGIRDSGSGGGSMKGKGEGNRKDFRNCKGGSLDCSAGGNGDPEIYSPTAVASSRLDSAVSGSGSGSGSSSGSAGSSVHGGRRRITATPVWKRPVVPLSKPYVPMPSKDSGRFSAVRS